MSKSITKLIISNKLLKACLKKIRDIVPKKPVLPILENIIFSAYGNMLTIMCTDLEVTLIMHVEIEAKTETEFVALIPFAWLYSICNIHGDEPMVFAFDKKKLTI